jgi:negative modulator of initiation of replication
MIEVGDEVFSRLEGASALTKIPIPQIVRTLVIQTGAAPGSNHATVQAPPPPHLVARDKDLCDHVRSQPFLANRTVVDRFLSVLSFVCKRDAKHFGTLTANIGGPKRKYIATNKQDLEDSGRSVNPKLIPGSNFWVVTNNDTENQKQLLDQILTLLGYSPEAVRIVKDSLS